MKRSFGPSFIVISAVCWGLIGIFVRELNQAGFTSIHIVGLRALGATILLALFLAVKDRQAFKIKWKDVWVFLGTGIGSMVFFNFCYFGSIRRTSLAVAAALLYTAPAFVAILAKIFLKETIGKRGIIAVCLAVLGCALTSGMLTSGGAADGWGFLLGLGSGFGYALYSIFGKIAIAKGYKSSTITFYTFFFATLCTCFSLYDCPGTVTGKSVLSAAGLIVISTILAYVLYTYGLSLVPAGFASVLASIEPVVAALISVFLFHEVLAWDNILGIVCILSSTIVMAGAKKGK